MLESESNAINTNRGRFFNFVQCFYKRLRENKISWINPDFGKKQAYP